MKVLTCNVGIICIRNVGMCDGWVSLPASENFAVEVLSVKGG